LVPQAKLDDVPNDIIFEITNYLDVVQVALFLSISTRFKKISTERIIQRINSYKEIIKYTQWNQGLALAASKADLPQIYFFISKGADNLETALAKACLNGDMTTIEYFLKLGAQTAGDVIAHSVTGHHHELTKFLLKSSKLSHKELQEPLCAAIKIKHPIVNDFRRLLLQHKDPFPLERATCAAAESGNKSYLDYLVRLYQNIPWTASICSFWRPC